MSRAGHPNSEFHHPEGNENFFFVLFPWMLERWGLRYRFAEGWRGAGVAVPDGGGELVYGLLEVLILPEPPPQLLEARLHRGLVRSGRRHGGRLWCGGGGQAGASGLDPRPVISRVRALVGLGGSKVGVGRRGGGIKERRVPVAGGLRRALAWRRGKKHSGRRAVGM